jgi:hypothetical protein
MSASFLRPLPRHPRRLGFIAFNLIVLILLIVWLTSAPQAGLADLPNFALANAGMVFVFTAWVVGWIAWAVMVLRRRRRAQNEAAEARRRRPLSLSIVP